ncbi:MAG TPA: nitroreductase/quinone reductase family protein [Anaerolineales bacterium]|nr:nitroreductase/quinone reductase family protein [Anaerolineales bacterium]
MQNMRKIGNDLMKAILRSPLHSLISQNTLLITVTGLKTGQEYAVPVNYVRDGDTLYMISKRCRTWWRNLRGGKPARIWLRGQEIKGTGIVEEEYGTVSKILKRFFQLSPGYAKYLDVRLDQKGKPHERDISEAAREI